MGGCLKRFIIFLLSLVIIFIWALFQMVGGIFGGVVCTGCVLFFCVRICRASKRKEQELSGDFDSYAGAYGTMKPEEIAKILLYAELKKREELHPVAKSTVKWRSILALSGIVVNFLLINCFYHTRYCILLCSLLALVFSIIWSRITNLTTLCKAAKRAPEKPFRTIVDESLCSEEQMPRVNQLKWGLPGLAVVSLVAFFVLNSAPVWHFSETASGVTVEKYRPQAGIVQQVEIPHTYNGKEVVAIGEGAFKNVGYIRSVTMPDSILRIGKHAFYNCFTLEQIELSSNLQSIGSGAFRNCNSLKSVTLPQSLNELLGESFMNCFSLTSVTIPESVTEIRGNTFDGCTDLEEVILHDGIVDIHAYAFQRCSSLKQIQLPASITEIHTYTFAECTSLKQIDIPSGVTRIAARAFFHCTDLEEVSVPDTVLEIRSSAFRECNSLKQIRLPVGVAVDEKAFKDSPTQIKYKTFSDEFWQQINDELAAKETTTFYYIYTTENPDAIDLWDDNTILIADDPRFSELLSDGRSLGELDGIAALLEHLEKAKSAGVDTVAYAAYSQLGTDEADTGKPIFGERTWQIDDMITQYRQAPVEVTDD